MNREKAEDLLNKDKLKIGNLKVEMKYSKNRCKIDECIRNILKQKIRVEGR